MQRPVGWWLAPYGSSKEGRLQSVIGPTRISRIRVRAKAQGGTAVGGGSDGFPAGLGRRSGPLEPQCQLVRVHVVKERSRALVEQVGIEAFGLEQRDPPLPD